MTKRISRHWADLAVLGLATSYALIFGSLSVLQYLTARTDGYDLAIFDQVVWNSLHSRLFENTILPDAPVLIGQRFSPILLAFVPLYALWNNAFALLLVQTLGIAISVLPLYWFARERLSQTWALLIATTYFLFPALQFVNLAEFHELALAIPLFAYATFFLLREKYLPFQVCLGVALLVKEEIALNVIMFGGFIFLFQRKRLFGLATMLFGATWFIVLLQFVLPQFSQGAFGEGYYYFGKGIAAGVGRYDYLGNSLSEIALTLVTRLDLVLTHLVVERKIEFVLQLLMPLAFLPFAGLDIAVLALPTFATSLLSDYSRQNSIEFHYTASLIPFLFFATVVGLQRIARWKNGIASVLGVFMMVASLGSYYFYAPGPLARRFDPVRYTLDAHTAQGHALLSQIPADAQVVVPNAFLPQLTHRQKIFGFPPEGVFCETDFLFADTTQNQYAMFADEWNAWLASGYFDVVARQDGFLAAKRKPSAQFDPIQIDASIVPSHASAFAIDAQRGWRFACVNVAWRIENADARFGVQARLEDQQGHVWATSEREFRANQSEVQFTMPLAPTMPPDDYRVLVNLNNSTDVTIATLPIKKDTRSYTASQLPIEQPLFVDMREMRLLGYIPPPATIMPGELLPVGIYWRARGKPQGDYMVAVQLRDALGNIALEHAARPANNAYPTTEWHVGEVLLDWHDLALPASLAPGAYTVVVLLRDTGSNLIGETRLAPIVVK